MNKNVLILTLGASVALTGCDSLLYSNTIAPISSVNQPLTQKPTPVLNQTMTSVTPPASNVVVVQQEQVNPYGSLPARPDNVMTISEQTQDNTVVAANRTGEVNDPKIREATEVLAADANNTVSVEKVENAPMRPTQTAVERPVKVEEKVSERMAESAASVNEQVKSVKENTTAVKETTAVVTEQAASVAKAVRPAPTTTKSATRALLQEAKVAVSSGQYDKAASALERAHRIEPGNAKILYDIAQIRYAQGKYRQASSFASKAATYSNSPSLSKKVWSLLSKARKKLGNNTGATAAAQKAASFQ